MMTRSDRNTLTASDLQIALSEVFPESTYGAIPIIDQRNMLEAYLAFEDGTLHEVPLALAEYIHHQQHCIE